MEEEHIISSGVLAKLLNFLCDFPRNNILHCVVFRCLQAIFSRSSTILTWTLVRDSSLPSFLAWEGTKFAALHQGRPPSYYGQIFALSKTLYNLEETDEALKDFLNKNEEGQNIDLYIPRKCSATNRLITSKDHASVQLNIGHVDENGIYTGQFTTFSLSGFVRA